MAQPTNIYSTYDLGGASGIGLINREDLANAIYNVDPYDTPIFSKISQKSKATATLHEWNTDILAAAAGSSVAQIEGDDAAAEAQSTPTRLKNTTAILNRTVVVSGTQQAVTTVEGVGREMARQIVKKGRELRRNIESHVAENVAGAAGNDTTARKMGGLEAWIITNTSAGAGATASAGTGTNVRTAGTARAFQESQLKEVLREAFNSGGNPRFIVTKAFNKQNLSAFAGNATRMAEADEATLFTAIDVYKSDFGRLDVVPNRFLNVTGAVDTVFAFDPDYISVAELRPIHEVELAKSGDFIKRALYWEGTLEMRNEKAHGAVYDLTQS